MAFQNYKMAVNRIFTMKRKESCCTLGSVKAYVLPSTLPADSKYMMP